MRYFTYVNNVTETGKARKKRTRNSYYGPQGDDQRGLYFIDTEGPLSGSDQAAVLASPLIAEIFGDAAMLVPTSSRSFIVTNSPGFLPMLPDRAGFDDIVQVGVRGQAREFSLRDRYNSCLSLLKATVGCEKCPDRLGACLRDMLDAQRESSAHVPDEDEMKAAFVNLKTQIAGFTFVSPVLTGDEFDYMFRHWKDHDFKCIDATRDVLSQRARDAAETRRYMRAECDNCEAKRCSKATRGTCMKWAWGRLATSDEIDEYVLKQWLPRYTGFKSNPLRPWQFWVLARASGKEGRWRDTRERRAILEGLTWSSAGDGFVIRGNWVYNPQWRGAFKTTDYNLVAEKFDLPRTAEEAGDLGTPPRRHEMALYFACLDITNTPPRPRYFGGPESMVINARVLQRDGIGMSFAYSRYSYGRPTDVIETWGEYYHYRKERMGDYNLRAINVAEQRQKELERPLEPQLEFRAAA
jgi:hypothetical protein